MKLLPALACVILLMACTADERATTTERDLTNLRGQWVVVNYWASWCKPCIEEIPQLNRLDSAYSNLTVVGVNYDGASGDELHTQAQRLGVGFATLAADPSTQLGISRPAVLPTTLILDPQGQLQRTLIGPQTVESLSEAAGLAGWQPQQ